MAKIIREDGRITYYYYKKKRGRHKKRGPKITAKKKKSRNYSSWDFKIIECSSNIQIGYIGKYHTAEEAEKKRAEIESNNSIVELPVKYINNRRISNSLSEYKGECIILKRIDENEDVSTPLLRNEFGKLVEHTVTSKKWYIYDKFQIFKEEHFWVYGYNPKTDRKDINFIYTNFIDKIIENTNNLIQISIYNNKVIFRYDFNEIEFVICKCVSDSIRIYNFLEEKYKKNKQVIFTGLISNNNVRTNEMVSLIQDKTGWGLKKIYKKTTF